MPNKYEAFNCLFRLGKCETKALLYLRYDEDPEKMDLNDIYDRPIPAHDKSRPVQPLDIAKATNCSETGMYIALKDCFFHGLVSRCSVGQASRGHRLLVGYFLEYKQNRLLRSMEDLTAEFYRVRTQ